jgi:hypothetical protein
MGRHRQGRKAATGVPLTWVKLTGVPG